MQVVKIKKLKSGENFLTHHWFIHNFPLPLKQVQIKFGLKVLDKDRVSISCLLAPTIQNGEFQDH